MPERALASGESEEWIHAQAQQAPYCAVGGFADIASAATYGLRVCLFVRCDEQPTRVGCDAGAHTVHAGVEGCCSDETGRVEYGVPRSELVSGMTQDCSRAAEVWARVYRSDEASDACVPYVLELNY
jgi:hypothetical protein